MFIKPHQPQKNLTPKPQRLLYDLSPAFLPLKTPPPKSTTSSKNPPLLKKPIRVTLFDVSKERIGELLKQAEESQNPIEAISVDCCQLSGGHFQSLWNFVGFRFVEKLFLRSCGLNLNEINVLGKVLEDRECKIIELDLRWNEFGDECAMRIGQCFYQNKSIEKLFLAKNKITSSGIMVYIGALIQNYKLELLDIEDNLIDNGELIAELLSQNNTLLTLQLTGNPISGKNLEYSLRLIGDALQKNLSLLKITLPKVTGGDKPLLYWIGIIDQHIKRNTIFHQRSIKKPLVHIVDDEYYSFTEFDPAKESNPGSRESNEEPEPEPVIDDEIKSIKLVLENTTKLLQTQLSQLSSLLQTEIIELETKCNETLMKHLNSEKKKINQENAKINNQLKKNVSTIEELERVIQTNKTEIESLLAVIREIENEHQQLSETQLKIKKDIKKFHKVNRKLRKILENPPESETLKLLKTRIDSLTQLLSQITQEKNIMTQSLQQQTETNHTLETLLSQFTENENGGKDFSGKDFSGKDFGGKDFDGKDQKSENECLVCQEKEKVMAFIPCGHLCICEKCAYKVDDVCPICRNHSTGKCKIYQ